MSKYLVLAAALIVLAVACGKPIRDSEAHNEEPIVPHELVCKDVKNGYERCQNDEVVCYELNTRIWCYRI